MIFSVWNPDGGYEYFETKQRHGIGDDLPDVQIPPRLNDIGIPAQDVGRPVPKEAKFVGRGKEPKGVMAPMSRGQVRGLSGESLGGLLSFSFIENVVVVGGLVWLGYRWGAKT